MKKILLVLVSYLTLTACSDESNITNFSNDEIIGTWEQTKKIYVYKKDGSKSIKPANLYDNRWRRTFTFEEQILLEGLKNEKEQFEFKVFQKYKYKISNNKLITINEDITNEQEIIKLNNNELIVRDNVEFNDAGEVERTYYYKKVN